MICELAGIFEDDEPILAARWLFTHTYIWTHRHTRHIIYILCTLIRTGQVNRFRHMCIRIEIIIIIIKTNHPSFYPLLWTRIICIHAVFDNDIGLIAAGGVKRSPGVVVVVIVHTYIRVDNQIRTVLHIAVLLIQLNTWNIWFL